MAMSDKGGEDMDDSESLDDLFCEIWERESKPELRFDVVGAGTVVQTQDLHGKRWEVNNFSNTVWEAAIWMHHFFQDGRCFPVGWLRGKRVLELGAGTGLVGLTLALLGAEVTMTDLPEALPILRYNTDTTFGPEEPGDANNSADDDGDSERCPSTSVIPSGEAKRPKIRQLSWGNSAEAASVAFDAKGNERSGGHGFDLIVGADVIYNEPTFPALVATLSDHRLCSEKTLVYLATKLRGGRHEFLLEKLSETFHVRALDPTRADGLRARVDTGRDWHVAEWKRGESGLQQRSRRRVKGDPSDSVRRGRNDSKPDARMGVASKADLPPGVSQQRHCSPEDERGPCAAAPIATEVPGVIDEMNMGAKGGNGDCTNGGCSSVTKSDVEDRDVWRGEWGYDARGLGTILSFVARRRDGVETCVENMES